MFLPFQQDETTYFLEYDQDITYDSSELSGFFYCCIADCVNALHLSDWPPVDPSKVRMTDSRRLAIEKTGAGDCRGGSLAYLWRQTPIQKPIWGAPIYSDDSFRVPSPPWIWTLI